jgi:hypothetical protein
MPDISNTVSSPVLIALLALIGGVGKIIVDLYQAKHKVAEAKEAADQAVQNTANVSNGFARDVGRKLDRIIEKQSSMEATLRDHLEYHLKQVGKEK